MTADPKRERCSVCNRVIYCTDRTRGLATETMEWSASGSDGIEWSVEHTYDCENVKRRLTIKEAP